MTTKNADAELHLPGGRVVSKQTDVNKEIERILGITRNQFVQISMIAQGEFKKILHAKTNEANIISELQANTERFAEGLLGTD